MLCPGHESTRRSAVGRCEKEKDIGKEKPDRRKPKMSFPRHDHTKLHHRLMCIRPYGCVYGRTARFVHEVCAQGHFSK